MLIFLTCLHTKYYLFFVETLLSFLLKLPSSSLVDQTIGLSLAREGFMTKCYFLDIVYLQKSYAMYKYYVLNISYHNLLLCYHPISNHYW